MKLLINNKIGKNIILTEEQVKLLKEDLDSFSFDILNNIHTFIERKNYCNKTLGSPIGAGTTRVVYMLNDYSVLKLAKNKKGIFQNKAEINIYNDNSTIFPKVFRASEDNMWIHSEYVLKAKKSDFENCLGISWDDYCKFTTNCFLETIEYNERQRKIKYFSDYILNDETFRNLIKNNWFKNICDYIVNNKAPLEDLQRIANYGLTERYGKPNIVILDSGVDENVWNNEY